MLRERVRNYLVAFSMTAASVVSALAQPGVSDPSHGRELADTLCSSCHEIEPGSKETLKTDVPTFFSIANRGGQTAEQLAGAIILSPHPEMPKAALTTRELRDIIAYVMSLRAKD
jgi:mono/diheme cytochrome c family protein